MIRMFPNLANMEYVVWLSPVKQSMIKMTNTAQFNRYITESKNE